MTQKTALDFDALRAANRERARTATRFARCLGWKSAEWCMQLTSELGEAAGFLSKIERGDFTLEAVREDVGRELADIVTCTDLLADHLGIDLGTAVRSKFNEVSRRIDSPVRLELSLGGVIAQVGVVLVDQTKFGGKDGNCLAACLATLLRLDIDEVPGFFSDDSGTWREKMGAWLVERGWGHLCIAGPPPEMLGPALSIVSGKSPRGDWLHATVWRGRELLHDPHPSRAGLEGEPVDTIVLVPLA